MNPQYNTRRTLTSKAPPLAPLPRVRVLLEGEDMTLSSTTQAPSLPVVDLVQALLRKGAPLQDAVEGV